MKRKISIESLIKEQKQAKATDYKSADRENNEHRGRVLAAVQAYCQGQRRGKRRNTHTHKQSGILSGVQIARARDSNNAVRTHRLTRSLYGIDAVAQGGSQLGIRKEGPLQKSKTPKSLLAAYSTNTNTSNLPLGVKL